MRVDEAGQDQMSAPVELSSIAASATGAKVAAMPAIVSPATAMSVTSGSCQLPPGSIGRPPRMISVVPGGIGNSDMEVT